MNKLFIILTIGLLISCNSQDNQITKNNSEIIRDTIIVTETIIDTVYVEKTDENDITKSEYYIVERLPYWVYKSGKLNGLKIKNDYEIENRLNPLYLEEDFNGDGNLDIALPIRHIKSDKVGFAILHGKTNEIFILGAGKNVKNGLSDNMDYISIWSINRDKVNGPGLEEYTGTGEKGELFLENPSIEIRASEIGGGLLYWNGKEYAYFHQTC